MFALWYLSLAVDELRKHFGWTFFDIFYKKANTGAEPLDIKPATNSTPIPSKPVKPSVPEAVPSSPPVTPKTNQTPIPTPEPVPASAPNSFPRTIPTLPKPVSSPVPTPTTPPPSIFSEPVSTPVPTSLATLATTKASPPTPAPKSVPITDPTLPKPVFPPATTPTIPTPTLSEPVSPPIPTTPKPAAAVEPSKPITPPVTPILSKPVPPPIPTTPKPAAVAEPPKPITPAVAQNSADERLFYTSKARENGEDFKNNIRNTTLDFLSGESATPPQPTFNKLITKSKQKTMVDAAVLTKLEEGYAKLAASNSKSLLKKYLTKEIFDNLKNKKTPSFGSTLLDCIQSGLENHDSGVGIYAPDAEAYTVFADLFDPIIEDYHGGFKKTDKHPPRDFGDVSVFSNLDPNNEFVISTRVRCGRSLQGYPFNPCLTEAQYKEMEQKVSTTLSGLEGELKGKFYPLTGMEKSVQQQLIDDHFLFKEGDRFLQAANACRYWPSGRGIFHNDNKTFLVWCNEEDHLRIISMQKGGDLGEVYRRLVTAVNEIEKRIPFSHDDRLGFLTFCPTNLGTTIRASVHIKVPKLAANKTKLEEVAGKYNLQVRGTRGEHTEAEGGIYDISNKRRMGLTEFQAVKEMYDGIAELIKIEKSM